MAATDQERLLLVLEAQTRQFERAINQARSVADREAANIEKRFQRMNANAARDFDNFRNTVAAGVAAIGLGVVVQDVGRLSDAWTRARNALSAAGVPAGQINSTMSEITNVAVRTNTALESTAQLFSRIYRSSGDVGASFAEVAAATELIGKALAPLSSGERDSAVVQFGQGLASGRFQGDELRSILENAQPVARAIADEFGVTIGELRELGKQGELVSGRVLRAVLNAGPQIEASFAATNRTIADSFTNLQTRATQWVGTSETTSNATRTFSDLVQATAENFEMLADAAIVAATVVGGAFAGAAMGKALTMLGLLSAEMVKTGAQGERMKALISFLGGPLGIALGAAAVGIGLLATQTDLLVTKQEALQRASQSSYSALQTLASLNEDLQAVAEAGNQSATEIGRVSEVAREADDALNRMGGSAADAVDPLNAQARITVALAEAQRLETLNTMRAAIANEQAAQSTIRRTAATRDLVTTLGELAFGRSSNRPRGLTADEQQQLADSRRRESIFTDGLAATEGLTIDAWEAIYGLRRNAAAVGVEDANTQARVRGDLRRQAELALARLHHDTQRVRTLEDAESIERRTAAYENEGLASVEARAVAEREVRAERAAMNAESARSIELARMQDEAEFARAEGLIIVADKLRDEVELRERIRRLTDEGMAPAEAQERATAFMERQRAAREAGQKADMATYDLQADTELARARGDERALEALERRAAIEERIATLRGLGVDPQEAVRRAELEVAALEQADLQGKFRDWFRDGTMAALEGDFGEFFQDWLTERWRNAMTNALNQVADLLYSVVAGAFRSAMSNGGGKGGNLFSTVLSSLFGGGKANGGPVNPGMFYRINENTPRSEFFVPQVPGTVVPFDALAALNRAQQVTQANVTQTTHLTIRYSVDLTGANGDAQIRAIAEASANRAFREAVNATRRGAPAQQRRYQLLGST